MKVVKGMEVVAVVRDGGPDGPAESLTVRVPPSKQWALVDAYDADGNLVGNLIQIDVVERPFSGPDSFGEMFRNRRIAARISLHQMAVMLCYTTGGIVNAVNVSDMESGRTTLTSIERLGWLGVLAKMEREGGEG